MRAIQPCALLREPVGTGTRSGNGNETALGRRVGAKTRRERENILLIFHIIQMLMGCCWWF